MSTSIELPDSIVIRDLAQKIEKSPIEDHQETDGEWRDGYHQPVRGL